jgi:hypothetical protein
MIYMKGIAVLLALLVALTSLGAAEAQRMPMRNQMRMPMRMDYRCLGLEDLSLIGPIFELIGHALFFVFSRSSMLCMRLAMRFVE